MSENHIQLSVTMPKSVFDLQMDNVIFEFRYQSHSIIHCAEGADSVCVTFSYDTETAADMIFVLDKIYKDSGYAPLPVDFLNNRYEIQDTALHKMILNRVDAQNHSTVTAYYLLNSIVKHNKITNLDMLEALAHKPFSGIMLYDHMDHYCITHDLDYLLKPQDPPAHIEIENLDFIISNRYITQDFLLKKSRHVDIKNCIISGDITLSSCENVSFWNCIITGNITCFGASRISIVECNASHFLIYNCTLSKFTLSWSKIYRFELHSSRLDALEVYQNKVIQPYLANLKLPDTKIPVDQFKFRNITPGIIRKTRGNPTPRFFLTYQVNKKPQKVTPSEIAIDTVDTLLKNGYFGNDYHALAVLKYKKLLYSNTGLKKIFILITGGFYFPSRWVLYLIFFSVLFTFAYWQIPSGFTSTVGDAAFQIDFLTALQYSMLQIIGANTLPIKSEGICQLLTVIHATLNTTIVANFFASIIKKYMGS